MSREPTDAAATKLARGPAKISDIEHARRDLARAEHVVAEEHEAAAVRCEADATRMEHPPAPARPRV